MQVSSYSGSCLATSKSSALIDTLESRVLLTVAFGVSQISSLPNRPWEYGPADLTAFENGVLFDATDLRTRRQTIWESDGTKSGTMPLPVDMPGDILLVGVVGTQIYFAAFNAQLQPSGAPTLGPSFAPASAEMYVTSNLGRTWVDLGPVPPGTGFGTSLGIDGSLYFTTSPEDSSGEQIWVSNGTATGTRDLMPPLPNTLETPVQLLAINNELLITGIGADDELVAINPATQAQQIIANSVSAAVIFANLIYFAAPVPATGSNSGSIDALWASNGTPAGTADLYATATDPASLPTIRNLNVLSPSQLLVLGVTDQGAGIDETCIFSGDINSMTPTENIPSILSSIQFDGDPLFNSGESSIWSVDGAAGASHEVLDTAPVEGGYWIASGETLFAFNADDWQYQRYASDPGLGTYVHAGPGQLYTYAKAGVPSASLAVTIVSSTLGAGMANSRSTGSMKIRISNDGDESSDGVYKLELALSTDGLSTAATLRTLAVPLVIKPGASKLFTMPIRRIPVVSPGRYYVIAQLSGPDSVFDQASTSSAIAISSWLSLTDMSVSTFSPDSIDDGGKITFDLVNNSKSRFRQSAPIGVWINTSDNQSDAAELDSQPAAVGIDLAAGRRRHIAITFDPSNLSWAQIGEFLILQMQDDLGDIIAQGSVVLS